MNEAPKGTYNRVTCRKELKKLSLHEPSAVSTVGILADAINNPSSGVGIFRISDLRADQFWTLP